MRGPTSRIDGRGPAKTDPSQVILLRSREAAITRFVKLGSEPPNGSAAWTRLRADWNFPLASQAMYLRLCDFLRCADIGASIASVRAKHRESGRRAQAVPWIFSLRVLAAQISLQGRRTSYHFAEGNAVIQTTRRESDTVSSQSVGHIPMRFVSGNNCRRFSPHFRRTRCS